MAVVSEVRSRRRVTRRPRFPPLSAHVRRRTTHYRGDSSRDGRRVASLDHPVAILASEVVGERRPLRAALFIPCYVDQINPEVGVSVVRVLRKLGVEVMYPEGQAGCRQRRELGVLNEPRDLLHNVSGLELLEWENEELCCGFGGMFSVKMPDVSTAMADEKIAALKKSGADTIISCDSSCLMHLGGRLRRTGHDTRVLHLAQILDSDGR